MKKFLVFNKMPVLGRYDAIIPDSFKAAGGLERLKKSYAEIVDVTEAIVKIESYSYDEEDRIVVSDIEKEYHVFPFVEYEGEMIYRHDTDDVWFKSVVEENSV